MINSLRKKFILINMALVFVVLFIVFGAATASGCRLAAEVNRLTLQMVINRSEEPHFPVLVIGRQQSSETARSPVFLVAVDSSGEPRLMLSENISVSQTELSVIVAEVLEQNGTEGILREYGLRWLSKNEGGETFIAFTDTAAENASVRNSILMASLSMITALIAFFAVSLFLSRWALRPVRRAWEQQKQFVADASHELKTPLTVILANTGILLENRHDTVENQIRWVENTATEAGRMQRLVGNLLFLAKTDDAKTPLKFTQVNLSDLVLSIALAFESLAYEKGLNINVCDIEPDIFIQGDAASLEQLVSILLENALKFSESGNDVTVALTVRQSKTELSVNNRGAPLSAEEQSLIFDRFYRADTARASEGYGLGLSIAKSVAVAHRGKISVDSSESGGTTFFVRL